MRKRKFGMQSLSVTQGRFTSFSHKNLNAMDLNGMDDGIDKFITFNELTLIKIYSATNTGYANTLLFYDAENDVTLAFAHMNSIPADYYEGRVFQSGEIIYYEGTEGYATGNHIHLEIGVGRQTTKPKIYVNGTPNWQLKNLINAEEYFYVDTNYTTIRNSGGYTWEKRSDSVNPPVVTSPSTDLSGCYLNATKSAFRVRSWAVNGTPLELVPIGGKAEILKFLGIQSDGYQWAYMDSGIYQKSCSCINKGDQL